MNLKRVTNFWTALVASILVVGSVTPQAWSADWDTPKQLTTSTFDSQVWFNWGKSIAADDAGHVHMVYLENTDGSSPVSFGLGRIHYLRSSDEGATWPVNISLTGPNDMVVGWPKVAAFDTHVYIAFQIAVDQTTPPTVPPTNPYLTIAMLTSHDRGQSWETPISISANPLGTVPAGPPSVFARGPFVHVTWNDNRTDTQEVYVRSSSDFGANWTAPVLVSEDDDIPSWTPSVALWGDDIFVAWTDEKNHTPTCNGGDDCKEELYFRRSLDFGANWDPEQRLTIDPPGQAASTWAPSIEAWEDLTTNEVFVHVVYFDKKTDNNFRVYYQRSEDGGVTWEGEVLLSDPVLSTNSYRPVITTMGGDQLHVVWAGTYNSGGIDGADVYYCKSEDQGHTWGTTENLTAGGITSTAHQPSIAVTPAQKVHVQWHDNVTGVNQIYYQRTLLP